MEGLMRYSRLRQVVLCTVLVSHASFSFAQCIADGGPKSCSREQPATWSYNACDLRNYGNEHENWCAAAGYPLDCTGATDLFPTDFTIIPISLNYDAIVHHPCSDTLDQDLGWGQTIDTNELCWDGGPVYTMGTLTLDFRHYIISGNTGPSCAMTYTDDFYAIRSRSLHCAAGSGPVMSECGAVVSNTCPAGHPIQPDTGNKTFTETDFSNASGTLTLTRTYNSFGFWQPPDSTLVTPGLFGDFWRTAYDSHVYPIVGSSYAAAAIQRPDGHVKYFTSSGREVQHFNGKAAETLVANSGGGWTYTTSSDVVETYDGTGRLTTTWDKQRLTVTLSYDLLGRLTQVTDAEGRSLVFTYTGNISDYSGGTVVMTVPDGSQYVYAVDNNDNLANVSYASGTFRSYLYENPAFKNAITGVVDENSKRYETVEYDSSGRATASYLEPNVASGTVGKNTFAYVNGTTTITDPLGQQRTLTFTTATSGVQNLATISAQCPSCGGNTQTTTYDANGYADLATDFDGTVTDYDYAAVFADGQTRGLETQRIEAETITGGATPTEKRTILTDWDSTFRVPTQRRTYNVNGVLEAKTDWTYNTRGQVTARCDIDPVDTTDGCSATSPPGTTAPVRRWAYTYCEQSDVNAGTCPLVGLLKSVDGPRLAGDAGMGGSEDTTTYTYYQTDDATCASGGACPHRHGDLWKVTNAFGQVTENVSYDKNGRVTRTKDPNGTYTDFLYHPRGWLTDRIVRANATGNPGPGDATTHIDYDAVGNVTQTTQPDGSYLAYTYDDAHRLIKIADALGNWIDYCPGGVGSAQCLDAAGNRLVEEIWSPGPGFAQLKRSLSRLYNALGQLTNVLNATGLEVEQSDMFDTFPLTDGYDPNGNRVLVEDNFGTRTQRAFDPLNRLKAEIRNSGGSDSTGNTETDYVYDTRDNLRQVTDPDLLPTNYTYDGLNNLTNLSSPDTGSTTYAYDKAGNRTSQTDNRGTASTYTYDRLNRLTLIKYPTTSLNVGYAHDQSNATTGCATSYPVGRLTTMTDGSGSTTYCYDRRGNVTVKKQVTNGVTLTTTYTYSTADRLASMTYPSGLLVTYARDAVGHVTFVSYKIGTTTTTLISSATYYPFGPLNVLTFGNGRTLTKTYDQDYAIDQITSSAAGGLTLDFGVDVMGEITSASQTIGPPTPDRTYLYDPLYRLTNAETGTASHLEDYTYDKTGDRLSVALNGGSATTYTYTANTHHLASVGTTNRSYDLNGNTRTGTATGLSLSYDDKNRLASMVNGTTSASYQTSGRGERVRKSLTTLTGTTTTEYVYDESGQLLGEYNGTGAAQAEYIYLDATPVAVVKSGALSYIEADHLGTPRRVVTPSTNAVVWSWDLLASTFGTNAPTGSTTLNLRFPGQYADSETGLSYNYFRDYEPGTGRYVESDPIGLFGGPNTYAYVGDSPLSGFDRDGLAGKKPSPPMNYLKECDNEDWKEAEAKCDPQNVLRCKRNYVRKLGAFNDGNILWNYVKADLQVECDDKTFCQRNPKTCAAGGVVVTVVAGAVIISSCVLGTLGLNPATN